MAFGFLDALTAAASLAAGTVTANPLVAAGVQAGLSGGKTALQGGNPSQIATSAAMSGAMSGAGAGAGALGGEVGGEVGKIAAPIAMNAGIGALRGQSLEQIGEGAAQGLAMNAAGQGINSLRGAPQPTDDTTNSGFAGGGEVPRGYTEREMTDFGVERLVQGIRRSKELDDRYNRIGDPSREQSDRYTNAMQALTGEGHNSTSEAARQRYRDWLIQQYGDEKFHNGRDPDLARANYMGFAYGGGVRRYEDGGEVEGNDRGGANDVGAGWGGDGGSMADNGGLGGDMGGYGDARASDVGSRAGSPNAGEMGIFGGVANYGGSAGGDYGLGTEGNPMAINGDLTNPPGPPAGEAVAAAMLQPATVAAPTVRAPAVSPLVRAGTINPDGSGFGYGGARYLAEGGRVGYDDGGWVDESTPWMDATPAYAPPAASSWAPATDYSSGGYYPVAINTTAPTEALPLPPDYVPPPEQQVPGAKAGVETSSGNKDQSKGGTKDDKDPMSKENSWWSRNKNWALPAGLGGGVALLLGTSAIRGSGQKTPKRRSAAQLQADYPENQAKPSTVVATPAGYRPGFSPEWNYIRYANGGRVGLAQGGYTIEELTKAATGRDVPLPLSAWANMTPLYPQLQPSQKDLEDWSGLSEARTWRGGEQVPQPYYPPDWGRGEQVIPRQPMPPRAYDSREDRRVPASTYWGGQDEPPPAPVEQRAYDSREDRRVPAAVYWGGLEEPAAAPTLQADRPNRSERDERKPSPGGGRGNRSEDDTRGTRPAAKSSQRPKSSPRAAAPRQREMTADDLNAMSLALSRARSAPEDQGRLSRGAVPAALRTYYGLAKGGGIGRMTPPTQQPNYERGMEGRMVMDDAEQALNRNHPDPDSAISRFRQYYGDDALATLMQKAKKGDGMSDNIPARIDGRKEAALSSGEYVIPADVVSHLGNGSSEAGTRELDLMNARVRKARTGNPQQGKGIRALAMMPR